MRKVIAYTTLGELQASPIYDTLRDCPHIGMSKRFNQFLREEGIFPNSTTFHSIVRDIAPGWKSDGMCMEDLSEITSEVRCRRDASADGEERLWLDGCLKQAYNLWSAITMLEEADVRPELISSENRDLLLMKDIWKNLESTSRDMMAFRAAMSSSNAPSKVLESLSHETGGRGNIVVIHGFYFITPLQERIIRLMEDAGLELRFLIQYDPAYPYSNRVWERLYNAWNGFDGKGDWLMVGATHPNDFGEVIEHEVERDVHLRLVEYRTLSEFVKDAGDSDGLLYCSDPDSVNDMLREFYPERYRRRPLISYPIGGFIDALHRMWDSERGELILDMRILEECFAYGWITYDGARSNAYLSDLQKMGSFFEGCSSLKQWDGRLRLLQEIYSGAVRVFDEGASDRWSRLQKNPLLNFGMFDLDDGGDAVISIVSTLLSCARALFGDNSGCSIREHTRRLEGILREQSISSKEMETELSIASEVMERIGGSSGVQFLPGDISNAVISYLRNESSDGDVTSVRGWVEPLHSLAAFPDGPVHVVMADSTRIPGHEGDFVWPLNRGSILDLRDAQSLDDPRPLLDNTINLSESVVEYNRYLLFAASSWSGDVTLSWVREMGGKVNTPTPYAELISSKSKVPVEHLEHDHFTKLRIDLIEGREQGGLKFHPVESNIPDEAKRDLALCGRRFLYGYVLNPHPTYVDKFNQGFLATGLLVSIRALVGTGDARAEEVDRNVHELFPNLTSVEWRNIVDNAWTPRSEERTMTPWGDRRYTGLRHNVEFPTTLKSIIENRMDDFVIDREYEMADVDQDRLICMYCPHSIHCPRARFQVDDNHD